MAPDHVLVPLDGSPLSDDALVHAFETFDCQVTVLNVVTPVDESMSESGVIETSPGATDPRERAADVIEAAKRRADEFGRRVDATVETGDPAGVILEYVDEHAVDHVVMGGHGDDGGAVARRLLGTVATQVVGEAPVPVTVVR